MKSHKLEAIYRIFPFLKKYTGTGDSINIEESPGGLGDWTAEKESGYYYDEYHLGNDFKLLDKDGKEILRVGVRQVWHPPKKFLWFWTIEGETKPEIFTETIAEALLRAQAPVHYILKTYPSGTSFILYVPPTGKTIEEWAQEKDRQQLEYCRQAAAKKAATELLKEEQTEAAIQAEVGKLLEKIGAADRRASPAVPVDDAPGNLIN